MQVLKGVNTTLKMKIPERVFSSHETDNSTLCKMKRNAFNHSFHYYITDLGRSELY